MSWSKAAATANAGSVSHAMRTVQFPGTGAAGGHTLIGLPESRCVPRGVRRPKRRTGTTRRNCLASTAATRPRPFPVAHGADHSEQPLILWTNQTALPASLLSRRRHPLFTAVLASWDLEAGTVLQVDAENVVAFLWRPLV